MAGMNTTRATKTRDELLSLVPRGAWDSHMHIFNGPDEDGRRLSDPAESSSRSDPSGTTATANSQPVSSHAPHQPPPRPTYQPPPSTIRSAIHLLGPIVPKMVIVQPSVLGEDNRVTLGGVRDLKRWGQSGSARLGEGGAESGIVGIACVRFLKAFGGFWERLRLCVLIASARESVWDYQGIWYWRRSIRHPTIKGIDLR